MATILIVDDEPEILQTIVMGLKMGGFGVETATDGVEAQAILSLRHSSLSAVILDWMMPRATGIEILQWMKSQNAMKDLPVIMHTGRRDAESILHGIEAGAYYYLPKPAGHDVLRSIVRAAIDDYERSKALLQRISRSGEQSQPLQEGTFRFRTLEEGDDLALRLAEACNYPGSIVAISEMFLNAIEHGNLGISYEEKTQFVDDGTWKSMVDSRLALQGNLRKHVEVTVTRYADKLTILVSDAGSGFDYRKYLTFDETRVFDNHGRGIALARSSVQLEYLGTGNSVLITIPARSH